MIKRTRLGLSLRGYARHSGLAVSYVSRLVRDGVIPLLPDGSVNAEVADAARAAHIGLRMGGKLSGPAAEVFQEARAKKEHFLAELAQLEYERLRGKLLDADKTLHLVETAFGNVRLRIRGVGKRMAPVLAGKGPGEIDKLLGSALDSALETLSEDVFKA